MQKKIILFLLLFLLIPKNIYGAKLSQTEVLIQFNNYALSNDIVLNPDNSILVLDCTGGNHFSLYNNDFSYSHLNVDTPKRIDYFLFEFDKNYKIIKGSYRFDTGIRPSYASDNIFLSGFIGCLDEDKNFHSAKNIIIKYRDGTFDIINNNNYCDRYYITFSTSNDSFCNHDVYSGLSLADNTIVNYDKNADFSVLNSNKVHVLHFLDYNNFFKTFISNLNSYLPIVFYIFQIILICYIIRYLKRF